jgi:hypothetical protein
VAGEANTIPTANAALKRICAMRFSGLAVRQLSTHFAGGVTVNPTAAITTLNQTIHFFTPFRLFLGLLYFIANFRDYNA